MWDLDTIKKMNGTETPDSTYARVFALGGNKFALGNRGKKALYVVKRVLAYGGRGRPSYTGVRGVRPVIGPELKPIRASSLLRNALLSGLSN